MTEENQQGGVTHSRILATCKSNLLATRKQQRGSCVTEEQQASYWQLQSGCFPVSVDPRHSSTVQVIGQLGLVAFLRLHGC